MDHYNTHNSYLRKVKKKSKSEKMISFPARPIFAFLFYEKTLLLVVVLENIMIIVN